MDESITIDIESLLLFLQKRFEQSLRSCVEYLPTSQRIHYLRDDIDRTGAEDRLVRIEELYQAERLSTDPIAQDPELGQLSASLHLFAGILVVHLIEPGGRVIGFSVDEEVFPEVQALVSQCFDHTR